MRLAVMALWCIGVSACSGEADPSNDGILEPGNDGMDGTAPGFYDAETAGAAFDDAGARTYDAGYEEPEPCADCSDVGAQEQPDAEDSDRGGSISEICFSDRDYFLTDGPDYDQFAPRIGAHCAGTNHQHIWGVEEVVFLGDSITVGSAPTMSRDFYRNKLAKSLAQKFELEPPNYLWELQDTATGTSAQKSSGNFHNCASSGARTADLLDGQNQIAQCFPEGGSERRTLVVMTIGANDVAAMAQAARADSRDAHAVAEQAVTHLEEAIVWLTDSERFPNGSFVVFANSYDYTDGTGRIEACPTASDDELDATWAEDLADSVTWLNEQWMRVAVETQTDMIFMLEHFCGHGFVATGPNADPDAGCYLGPNTPRWFDDTCVHPNPTGHHAIARMIGDVIEEPGTAP